MKSNQMQNVNQFVKQSERDASRKAEEDWTSALIYWHTIRVPKITSFSPFSVIKTAFLLSVFDFNRIVCVCVYGKVQAKMICSSAKIKLIITLMMMNGWNQHLIIYSAYTITHSYTDIFKLICNNPNANKMYGRVGFVFIYLYYIHVMLIHIFFPCAHIFWFKQSHEQKW